jgi:hypothetical protein
MVGGGRRMRRAGVLALLLAAAIAAPAVAGDSATSPPEEGSAPDANLFVYRDAANPAACAAWLYLDGRRFADLPQHSYTSISVRPGFHDVAVRWATGCGHGEVVDQVNVQDRRLYYFALTGDARLTREPLGAYATTLHETTTLTPVDPDEGVQTVAACCRFVPADARF